MSFLNYFRVCAKTSNAFISIMTKNSIIIKSSHQKDPKNPIHFEYLFLYFLSC